MSNTELVEVNFHGDAILTFKHDGKPHVAMRRVVQNLGLAWPSQSVKLREQRDRFSCYDIVTAGVDGKSYLMMAMPIAKLPLWLATINPNKIPDPHKRAKVEQYQAESAIVLHDYWTKGIAVRGDSEGIVSGVDAATMRAIGGMVKGIIQKNQADIKNTIQALVNEQLLTGDRRVIQGMSALEVSEKAGYTKGKRPKGLTQFITGKLLNYHIRRKFFPERSPHGSANVWVYNPAVVKTWLSEGGQAEIDNYAAKKSGQGSFRLVK